MDGLSDGLTDSIFYSSFGEFRYDCNGHGGPHGGGEGSIPHNYLLVIDSKPVFGQRPR